MHTMIDTTAQDAAQWAARVGSVAGEDLPVLLDPTDHTLARLFERFAAGTLHSSPQYGIKSWSGQVWEDDSTHGRHRDLAIETIQILMASADTIPIPPALLAQGVDRDPTLTVEDVEAMLRKTMRAKLKKWQNAGKLDAMIEMATARQPFLADIGTFDQDPLALTTPTGVLDLATGRLRPARPADRLTKMVPVPYDPDSTCPRFQKFLTELFPTDTDDLIAFLQRFVGLCLTGLVREHVLPIFWGTGRNGKTTLLTVLQALLGPFAQVAPLSLLLESKHGRTAIPNDVARLVGVRLVVTSETPEHGRLAESTVKVLTGGDRLTGRFLHREFFDFNPTHKVLLVTNHKPVIRGQDQAIWSRIALVPFTVRFWTPEEARPAGAPLQDPTLATTLLTELPGILNWALEGCGAWQRDGLHLPPIVQTATAEYRAEEDVLKPFLEACCLVDAAAWIAFDALYPTFETWATEAHERPLSKQALGRLLTERGFPATKEGGTRGRKGLCLR
jgi:putative DNA primase/helicase